MNDFVSTSEGLSELAEARRRGLTMFTPPPLLTISEWADRFARLPRESSAEPGQWQTARAEYQREPMDCITRPETERVVMIWASQTGKSAILLNVIGYYCHQDPAPILMVQDTLQRAEDFSKDRIATMIRDTPSLSPLFGDPRSRDSGNTLLHKTFPGGHLTIAGSNAPGGLAMRPIRVLICDEIGRYPASAGTEGDPVALAEARTTTFWNRKKIFATSPTLIGDRAGQLWEESTKEYWVVPCPQCSEFQRLQFSQLKWPSPRTGAAKHEPDKCFYVCEHSGCEITEADKPWMIAHGKWQATAESSDGKTRGFHVSQLYSPWKTWPEIINEFLRAKQKPDTLQVFTNTVLGEWWETQGETVSDSTITDRCEEYAAQVPAGALVLTAAVDVQNDRLEAECIAWGEGEESWSIEHQIFRGNPAQSQIWDQLDSWLQSTFEHETGVLMRIACALVDSGGAHTNTVYKFCKRRQSRMVFACKGVAGAGRPIAGRPTKNNRIGALLFPVGADTAKDMLYARLKLEHAGPGFCHFPTGYRVTSKFKSEFVSLAEQFDKEYFLQLTAEKAVTYTRGGQLVRKWEKKRPRNEALDLHVYAMAALDVLKPNFAAIAENLGRRAAAIAKEREEQEEEVEQTLPAEREPQKAAPVQRPQPGAPRRSSWVNAWKV